MPALPSRQLLDTIWQKFDRRVQLLNGSLLRLRGAEIGLRFGVGRDTRIYHPECLEVGDDVSIGDSSFLDCLSHFGVHIGNRCSLDRNLWLHCGGTTGPNGYGFVEIGDGSYIGCNAVIGAGGGIRIGCNVLVGQSVNMHAENHLFQDRERLIKDQGVAYKGIVIGDDVWIGSKVTILDGVTVGRGSVIAAGAVVSRSIPPFSVAAGVPAKVIRTR